MQTAHKEYDKAEQSYKQALELKNANKDEVHFSWAKALYNLNLDPSYKVYGQWTMEQLPTSFRPFRLQALPEQPLAQECQR